MALEPDFLGAFVDGGARYRILSTELRPFCLWHLLLLQGLESPFLRKGEVTWWDLRTALGVCRLSYPDSRIVRPRRPLFAGIRLLRKATHGFLGYAGDHLYRPEYKVDGIDKAPPKVRGQAPEVLTHFSDLYGWGTWKEAEVWNMPLSRAHWYRPMSLRGRGIPIAFQTLHDREFLAALKAQEEAKNGSTTH